MIANSVKYERYKVHAVKPSIKLGKKQVMGATNFKRGGVMFFFFSWFFDAIKQLIFFSKF